MSTFDSNALLKSLPSKPGIYQMLGENGEVLYVGKARNLQKRVSSYFHKNLTDPKTRVLMKQVRDVSITITGSENEALLLESTLIKKLKTRYNILFRDDKSYPYLFLSAHKNFPRLDFHRGVQRAKGQYFGPYPSGLAVRETLNLLQKVFMVRQCNDSFFRARTRPCLQYQIKRCTAPCVAYVTPAQYQQQVRLVRLFLNGKSNEIIQELGRKMESAASEQNYESAAKCRDQIAALRQVQARQYVTTSGKAIDVDVMAIAQKAGLLCVQVLFFRAGRLIGSKSYFPKVPKDTELADALTSFLPQFYLSEARGEGIPKQVIVNIKLVEKAWISSALSEKLQTKTTVLDSVRGKNKQWLSMATVNVKQAINTRLTSKSNYQERLFALQKALNLPNVPQLMECFDVSHHMGEATVASCVVFNEEGPEKKYYRKFNITDVKKGDDYAALKQAITRRYTKLKEKEAVLPDILFIDGGKGQLSQAEKALESIQVSGVQLVSIAKGEGRKPGLETLFLPGHEAIHLPSDSLALHFIQQVRDEAHRFAIMAQRKKLGKKRTKSILEDIAGVGAKRRRELLKHFGGLQELKRASAEDIARVPGISKALALKIRDSLA